MHTHLEQWAADTAVPGEQLRVRFNPGSHLSHGQFLPEPRFKPTTSGYKYDALSIRATTAVLFMLTGKAKSAQITRRQEMSM